MKADKNKFTYGVNICSVCDAGTLTVGQQKFGGIRYCKNCIQVTYSYFGLDDEHKKVLLEQFDLLSKNKKTKKLIEELSYLSQKDRHNIGIGESINRVHVAELEELRKP